MVLVRETVMDDWRALRDIRLEALRDAPSAFGSTYEREALRGEEHWCARIARGGAFLAFLPEVSASEPAGLIGGYQEDPVTVELVSMYVRPRARGRGVGEALVDTVVGWAAARNATSVHLWVTETNSPARGLYERCGFALTGERQPLPSDPSIGEVAMARPLLMTAGESTCDQQDGADQQLALSLAPVNPITIKPRRISLLVAVDVVIHDHRNLFGTHAGSLRLPGDQRVMTDHHCRGTSLASRCSKLQ